MVTSILRPRDAEELRRVVEWAVNDGARLAIEGRGSKRAYGPPRDAAHTLSLSELAGVVEYQPEELVITARAGTPIREIEALLAQRRQMLAFEPSDLGAVLGGAAGEGTLAGALMCNLAGPRRISHGAARDHFLGFSGVNGRAERFKSGGKVMKNVTGYDLSKLMAGSRGTLAALDEISVKTLPAPEKTRTLLLAGLDDAAGVRALCAAMGSPHEVSGAAHLPVAVAARATVDLVAGLGGAVTAIRVEGVGPSVEARLAGLRTQFAGAAPRVEELHTLRSLAFWTAVRDARPVADDTARPLWRLSCPPTDGPAVVAAIRAARPDAEAMYDWSGGLVWLSLAPATDAAVDDAAAPVVRGALSAGGGHATLVRAPEAVRARVAVFHPQPAPLAALAARVRGSFDPKGVFAGA
ncbi:MAG: FAD-binding protein [Rhodospirillales bacterium]|nr:MAG: FAD-binding protein [Rhodospirillales bacterium]